VENAEAAIARIRAARPAIVVRDEIVVALKQFERASNKILV
jgi:hypothetical protein